jgi:LPXTG-motif cell wall-anchored protein
MRQIHRWTALVGATTLLMGLGFLASPGPVVQAVTTVNQIGADIDGENERDESGFSVAMSADGTRIAIGAPYVGMMSNPGYVRVYTSINNVWTQTGGDIIGEAAQDFFGTSVAMSADGTRIAIGAPGNNAGYVRVYTLTNNVWTQTGGDIIGEDTYDNFGRSLAMSADGSRIAIGAPNNSDNSPFHGHVRVYTLSGDTWLQTGADIDGEDARDASGFSVAMSADGAHIAIGAPFNTSGKGHVRVYTLSGDTWLQTGADIDGKNVNDESGMSVAMSADGTRIAIGASGNTSGKGHVRVYTLSGGAWQQTGNDIDGEATNDLSGKSVAMTADGNRIAIGAPYSDGVDGNFNDTGRVRIYNWDGSIWMQVGIDIDGKAPNDLSGSSVALSTDGTRIAIGAPGNTNRTGHVRVFSVQDSPGAPTISAITAGDGVLTVSFSAGTENGSTITNFKYSIDGTNYIALNPTATTSPFTISGLTNGTSYSVTIKSVNAIGDSPASNAIAGTPVASATTVSEPTTTTAAVPTTTVATPTATPTKVDSLPETGNNSSTLVFISALLVIGGITLSRRHKVL